MQDQYIFSGSLPENANTYVKREADEELYEALLQGNFCYVLNSRQTGKSSLRVRTMSRLREVGVECAAIDLSSISIQTATQENWYADLIVKLIDSFILDINFKSWWEENKINSPLLRFSNFLTKIVLTRITENIVIFIDEIDSVLSLNFPTDDFFAFIRSCYNLRVDNPQYNRLTFCLLGVASPTSLIQDKKRTPFNIGQAISLKGFQLYEIEPLEQGLRDNFNNSKAIMQEILQWTGGQPFLTQKLCQFMVEESEQEYPRSVEQVVRSRIIENWESQDEPEHLRTIQARIVQDEQRAGYLLELYQKIRLAEDRLQNTTDEEPEQSELQLSGLVVRQEGKLRIYNHIYREIFNYNWIETQLNNLRPYSTSFRFWMKSGRTDESQLLRGKELQEAEEWAKNKKLSFEDRQFIAASKTKEIQELALKSEILTLCKCTEIMRLSNLELDSLLEILKAVQKLKTTDVTLDYKFGHRVNLILQQIIDNIKEKNRIEGHTAAIRNVSFRPNSDIFASGSDDGTVRIWNLKGEHLNTFSFNGPDDNVRGMCFSPSGEILAVGSTKGILKLWQVSSQGEGKEIVSLQAHKETIRSVAFNLNGKLLASASGDGTIKILKLNNQGIYEDFKCLDIKDLENIIKRDKDKKHWINSISFSPCVQKKIVSGNADGTVRIWNINTGENKKLSGHKDWVNCVCFSPDGKRIASSSRDNTVIIWGANGEKIMTIQGYAWITSVIFHPKQHSILAIAGDDNKVKLFNLDEAKFLNNDKILEDRQALQVFSGHTAWVSALSFNQTGETIASVSGDNSIRIWSLHKLNSFKHTNWVNSVSFDSDGRILASGSSDCTIKLWNLKGELIQTLKGHKKGVMSVRFSPDGYLLASGGDDCTIKIWKRDHNSQFQELFTLKSHSRSVKSVRFNRKGNLLASGSDDSKIKLWNPYTGEEIHTFLGHTKGVRSVRFSPDDTLLASGSDDTKVIIWKIDIDNKIYTRLHTLDHFTEGIRSVRFKSDGKTLASGSNDGTIKLWDVASGEKIDTRKSKGLWMSSLSFNPQNESVIAYGGADGVVRLSSINGKELQTLKGHTGWIRSVSFSADGKILASASIDGTIRLWYVNPDNPLVNEWIKQGCDWVQNYLRTNPNVDESDRSLCQEILRTKD
ncbi:AAA-like domain-containing protein [Nostoc sp. FACHB-87]|uniref:WD40 domain-containing protein n=1 Tax=Nostocaceae TaxID=1162 RepID=UPI001682A1A3|nr:MULTISPECIES: AAA-like domain-containing protein [Nostocaceae]MBD2459081.1 AAA-like domain-containing protein [Nostoc sp. FACHB-87]MBD2480109.1 AAA-like domain-containing protein [Anabaena sp. FACHB-83]